MNSGTISGGLSGDGVSRANAVTFTGGTNAISFLNATSGLTGNIGVEGTLTFNQNTDAGVSNAITGSGSIEKTGAGTLMLSASNTFSGGTSINEGTVAMGNAAALGAGTISLSGGGLRADYTGNLNNTIRVTDDVVGTVSSTAGNVLTQTGGLNIARYATLRIGTTSDTGTVVWGFNSSSHVSPSNLSIDGGTLRLNSTSAAFIVGRFGAGGALVLDGGVNVDATLDINGLSTTINKLTGGATGVITNSGGAATLTTTNYRTTTYSGSITDGAGALELLKTGPAMLTLAGTNAYTGATVVNGGRLSVDGSISSSSLTTVNAAGELGGNGIVGNTLISGGTLAPGNSIGVLNVQGNLSFTAASSYMVEVSPTNADRVNVTGRATLGGATVNAYFAAGSYVDKQYTIVNATGGVVGTFGTQVNTDLPSNFKSRLSYDANNAYLDLALSFDPPTPPGPTSPVYGALNANQAAVGDALVGFFNRTGGIPLVFGALNAQGLTQASGELGTSNQQTTFDAMNMFMGVITDPFAAGREVSAAASSTYADEATAYADRRRSSDAFAAITKALPMVPVFQERWNVWAAGFGGSRSTDGSAVTGSNNTTSSVYGMAVGADYWFSPSTVAGFALAGGGTIFSVNDGGSGRSDLFQAGAFVRQSAGSAYITAAAAYGWQDMTTDRAVTVAGLDRLRAQFKANSYSGRVEIGNRFVLPWMGGAGVTPYTAAQVTVFDLPSYAESVIGGADTFAVAYRGKMTTATRSELGFRTDKSFAVDDAILTLRGRAAWAHDFNPDRSIAATFQTLPGASFVVNGAAQSRNAVLTTASAEMKWVNGWSVAGTFDGEFSDVTRSYAGKGVLRYAW